MVKLFITGGCGFIGSHLVRECLRRGMTVVNYDALTYAAGLWHTDIQDRALARLADVAANPQYRFIEGDVTNETAVVQAMVGCTHVLHLAAESNVDRSIHDAAGFVQTNALGTQTLLDIARFGRVQKLLYASTDEVYGAWGARQAGLWTEESPIKPRNPYAASKAAGEHLCRAAFHTHDIPVLITRGCNTYGPGQHTEKFIPRALRHLIAGQPIPVFGNGEHVREWLHVYDHVRGILRVLFEGSWGETYNISGGTFINNRSLAERLITLYGSGTWESVPDRKGHDARYASDPAKLDRLGWQRTMLFEDGLADTVAWYRQYWKTHDLIPEIAWEKQRAS